MVRGWWLPNRSVITQSLYLTTAAMPGTVDQAGLFTGDSIAYLYPDLSTALVGIFKDGVMVAAKPARLERVKMVEGIASPVFSILGDQAVSYCLSTEQSVGENPTVPDPYEGRTVQVPGC